MNERRGRKGGGREWRETRQLLDSVLPSISSTSLWHFGERKWDDVKDEFTLYVAVIRGGT